MSAPMSIHHRRTPSMTYYAPQPTHARSLSGQFGTSWSDPFDFTMSSPLTSALHLGTSPPMGNAYLPSTYALSMSCSPRGDYSTFERDYCSNFACCGITLPDMHALVAHFEEIHLGASEGAPFTTYPYGQVGNYGIAVPQAKPVPQVSVSTNNGVGGDAPSPNSSIGPETPPPSSHVPAYAQQPHLHLQVQTQLYHSNNSSRANSASPYPHSPFSAHSPYAASSLSAGSPASSGSLEHSYSSGEELEVNLDADVDVLMSFDPLDGVNSVHTPLDSTPPSPLAPPIRPSSVLRAAALKNNGGQPDTPPVCLPPSLFSVPVPSPSLLSPNVEKGGVSGKKEKKDRKEREKERKSCADSPAVGDAPAAGGSSSGGAVRREKNRKAASTSMNSLLGLGSSSRSSIPSSSSDEPTSPSEAGASAATAEKAERPKEVVERPRAERTGRPERVDKSGKRTREKAYKCPKPGCTKSYLNPNGLKYHCAKGTCTFANGSGPPTPVTPTTPSIPSTPPISYTSNAPTQCNNSQPMTPTSLPSSPLANTVNAVQAGYEYRQQQQVPIIATPIPVSITRDATAFVYTPASVQMC